MTRLHLYPSFFSRLTVLLAVLAGVVLIGAPAHADESTEASAALDVFGAGQHVYVSGESGQQVDAPAVADAVGDDPVFVAVVPPNTPPDDVLVLLREGMQQPGTYVVVSGTEHAAQSSVICSTQAQPLLDEAAASQADSREAGDLTGFLIDYLDRVDSAAAPGDDDCGDEVTASGSFWSAVPWILGALVIGGGGGYLWVRHRQGRKAAQNADRSQAVADALDALARNIDGVADERDPQVARALHDARERHIAAADILADAEAPSDFDAALRATREGAVAVHYARERAGLSTSRPGEVEQPRTRRVEQSELVVLGDEQLTAHRDYRPGAPYFFAGNDELPAGWYSVPVGSGELLGAIADDE